MKFVRVFPGQVIEETLAVNAFIIPRNSTVHAIFLINNISDETLNSAANISHKNLIIYSR